MQKAAKRREQIRELDEELRQYGVLGIKEPRENASLNGRCLARQELLTHIRQREHKLANSANRLPGSQIMSAKQSARVSAKQSASVNLATEDADAVGTGAGGGELDSGNDMAALS